ncbi:MAG: PorT family protein [Bacteroidetes bacterium]|nr:PorT family protein [Bacteroidota bacterium]
MKKYFILVLACLFSQLIMAQLNSDSTGTKKKKKVEYFFYLTGGGQSSGLNGSDDSYDKALIGFFIGAGIRLAELNDLLGLRTELVYSMQGSKYDEGYYGSGKMVLSYLNLPVLLRRTSHSGFYAEAGVQPGVLLSAKDKYEGNTNDYKEYTKKFDVAGLLGAGYAKDRFGVGIRAAQGFIDVNKPTAEEKDRNFVLSLRGTFAF